MLQVMIITLLYVLAALSLLLTVLPLSTHEAWWVRAADFLRLQVAVLTVITFLGLWLFGDVGAMPDMLIAVTLGAATCCNIFLIAPYTPLWPVELKAGERSPGEESIILMVANVLMDNRETERLFAMIRDHRPDVFLAVETDRWWCEQLEAFTADYPFKISHPADNTYGMYLCSKLELINPEVRCILKPDVPSIRTGIRLRSGDEVLYHALHPEPPSPTEADSALPRDAELVTVAKEIADSGQNAIVAGDFNDVAWSHTSRLFRRLGGILDPRVGRGLFSTFHARWWPCRWPLDHVFASDDFVLQKIERLGAFGSDHFPIVVTLSLAPKEALQQAAPAADDQDIAEADDKIERGVEALNEANDAEETAVDQVAVMSVDPDRASRPITPDRNPLQ